MDEVSNGWRSIESAPKDGREILGCITWPQPSRFVVIWNGIEWYAGWGNAIQPRYWQPLPDVPALDRIKDQSHDD